MPAPHLKRIFLLLGSVALFTAPFVYYSTRPRVLAVSEVPIAFWAWRNQAPNQRELQAVFDATKSKTLFLRAGQFDLYEGTVERARPVRGMIPSGVELHLSYNATRRLLLSIESVSTPELVEIIADTFRSDLARSERDGAQVHGLQLDFDIPNRLLPKYAALLHNLRSEFQNGIKLSITGLPTWMATNDIESVLAEVDFWIPQCYGGEIPTSVTDRIPISSPADVARSIGKARRLNKPFYAGLSVYSYAILYGSDGNLIELRGDINPAAAYASDSFELIDRRPFGPDNEPAEVRYEYLAKDDLVLDGLVIRTGQSLVFDLPNSASLRASARAVRENAGDQLLGICIFRLPATEEATILTVNEIVSALHDVEAKAETKLEIEPSTSHTMKLIATNTGTASSTIGDDAVTIEISIPVGSVDDVRLEQVIGHYETVCRTEGRSERCSSHRANTIRVRVFIWKPGNQMTMTLRLRARPPAVVPVVVTMKLDDGRTITETARLITGQEK